MPLKAMMRPAACLEEDDAAEESAIVVAEPADAPPPMVHAAAQGMMDKLKSMAKAGRPYPWGPTISAGIELTSAVGWPGSAWTSSARGCRSKRAKASNAARGIARRSAGASSGTSRL